MSEQHTDDSPSAQSSAYTVVAADIMQQGQDLQRSQEALAARLTRQMEELEARHRADRARDRDEWRRERSVLEGRIRQLEANSIMVGSLTWEDDPEYHSQPLNERYRIYDGQKLNGQPHGSGTVRKPGGSVVFSGDWQHGKRHGRGTEFRGDGQLVYDGEWANGEKTNRGEGKVGFMELRDDKGQLVGYYHGETQDGQPNGEGELRDGRNNAVYKGGWKNGKQHGQGRAYYDGYGPVLWFDGEWREGLAHSGTLFPDGDWSGVKKADGSPLYPITPIQWQAGHKLPSTDLVGGYKLHKWLQYRGVSGYFPAGALGE